MRRLLATALVTCSAAAVVLAGTGAAGDSGGDYLVRAIFDNASAVVPGEDVKVAGARVGAIDDMEVTPDNRAAIVLRIEDPGFRPFRADASCTVRPQSLIGEKFVECSVGTPDAPELERIPDGSAGEGEHLLPLERTSSPVDIDLVNNTLRRPFRERLAIVLSEFGTGVAGRGRDLNEVIHRANPALRQTDRVLAILARQNRVLADLARDSDEALAPLARERRSLSGFVRGAGETAAATAERREDLARSLRLLPRLLPELRGTLRELDAFAADTTPALRDLRTAAPDLERLFASLGPFSRRSTTAIETLGDATDVGGPALENSRGLLRDLRGFARALRPLSVDLGALTDSLTETDAIERIMDYLFFQTTAVNGFDGLGHYLRAGIIVNTCSVYSVQPAIGCSANFSSTRTVNAAGTAGAPDLDPRLAETREALERILRGGRRPAESRRQARRVERRVAEEAPEVRERREKGLEDFRRRAAEPPGPREPLLDYLLGREGS